MIKTYKLEPEKGANRVEFRYEFEGEWGPGVADEATALAQGAMMGVARNRTSVSVHREGADVVVLVKNGIIKRLDTSEMRANIVDEMAKRGLSKRP